MKNIKNFDFLKNILNGDFFLFLFDLNYLLKCLLKFYYFII